ncbi:hypothetical protein [Corallococcus aberystwythensis]|uniref:VWA domain-containing protein n=1 Tax=Corallococcus aberystwythensis TaxID=2316722 RepID=A0A3A8PPI4_9BACT|nr:hypothetical protein [Corallococcus aberystwythensis]RKH57060.1 hypothetical protein D7W81_32215 [Corallococcus aberystwythensis]
MSKANGTGVTKLFEDAHAEGILSPAALQTLTVVDLGAQIQAGLGIHVDDVQASEVVLVTVMPDDSGSISHSGHTKTVCDGHNLVLDSLLASQQKDGVLFHTRYLNGHVLNPFRPLEDVVRMHSGNYSADMGTPLYDQAVVLLGTVLAKAQEFSGNGVPVRTVTLLITDGADAGSQKARAKDVAALVKDLHRVENHIVAAMGIDDGTTDFRRVFQEMGIADRWILTPGQSAQEIRAAFQVFSQSAVRVSQGAASFSRTALGGFGA